MASPSRFIRNFFKYIRYCSQGGYTHLSLSTLNAGELLAGKRAIITGGSEGIGLATAKAFLAQGAQVLITGRKPEKLEAAKVEIADDRLKTLVWDVADIDNLEQNLHKAIDLLGGLDIFVNNAAFLAAETFDAEFYHKCVRTNQTAPYFLCRYLFQYYKATNAEQGGKIINISSINAQQSSTHPYYLSKSALDAITRGYAKAGAPYNIIVNAIAPGYCASSINRRDLSDNAYNSDTPNRRILSPSDIAQTALFLASPLSNAIIGQTIVCDGGQLL